MRIVFLCGSLELGCDGVGDYTRRLAGVLSKQGYKVCAIALNDAFISTVYDGSQLIEGVALPVLRLPANEPSQHRFSIAEKYVDAFNPSWISLQFVPFAYHPKGLPFRLGYYLLKICKGRKLHVMVHELWVGMEKGSSKKLLVWSAVQKLMIHSLFQKLKPTLINSQIQLYIEQILRLGFKATLLPLFSNIPVHSEIQKQHSGIVNISQKQQIIFVVFGTVHPGAPITEFASEVLAYSKSRDIETILTILGRSGSEQKSWVEKWTAVGLPVIIYAEQSEHEISRILSLATVGISSNPIALVGKSGTVAAMCEHGLPVLCVSHSWIPRHKTALEPLPGISEYHPGKLENYLDSKITPASSYNVCDIASSLIKSLQILSN